MDEEVYLSTSKIRSSAAFGEIIILIVYIPILTLIGIEGKMFRPMAQTVGFAIFGALILSLTYIPMMSALLLSKDQTHKVTFSDRMMAFFQKMYAPLLEKALGHRKMIVSITIGCLLICAFIFSRMGGEFIPTLQEGDFAFHCILPQGTSLSQSIETSMQASRIIKQFDEVKMVVGKTGAAEVPTDPMPPEATDIMVILKQPDEWKRDVSYNELADEINEKLEAIPGVFFEKNQPIQMRFNELMTGIRQDVAVKIFGEDLDTLLSYANRVKNIVQNVEGSTEPMVERVEGLPQVVIKYNRAQIANYGLNINEINHMVSTAFAGGNAGVVYEKERRFDLVVRLDSAHRNSFEDVGHLYIPDNNGRQIPLSQVAEIKMELGPAQISREDGKRRIVVGFNVKGRDVASVVKDIQVKLDQQIKLPEGYFLTYGGTFENLKAASKRLMIALPVALALIFMLLYFTFHSVKQAVLIFTAIPMSAIGGVLALLIRDMPFSISAGIGFIALFGVAVLNGIVLIGTFNQLEKDGMKDIFERIRVGTRERLRPVLMTATVASLGFLPMALSHGAGAEVQKPLATVVIGGLASATFLTLFVLPILYYLFMRKGNSKRGTTTLALFVIMLCAQNISAQSASTLSVDEAVSKALKNSLFSQAASLRLESARKLSGSYFELPKTGVNIQYGQYNSINKDLGFSISQTIPFPTYYSAKSNLYSAQLQSESLKQQVTAKEITALVQRSYYELQFLQVKNIHLARLDSAYDDFVRTSALRYKTGETNLLEKTTAEAKQGRVKLLIIQNNTEIQATLSQLKAYINSNEEFSVDTPGQFEPILLSETLDTSAIVNTPAIKLLYQQAEIARLNKKVESSQLLPDLTIGYFNQSLTGVQTIDGQDIYFDRTKRFTGFNAGITIPLTFLSTSNRLKSLEFEKQALIKEADYSRVQTQVELQNAFQRYAQSLNEYNYYKSSGLSNLNSIINTAGVAYKSGSIGYIEYLQSIETTIEIRLAFLQAVNNVNRDVININYLLKK